MAGHKTKLAEQVCIGGGWGSALKHCLYIKFLFSPHRSTTNNVTKDYLKEQQRIGLFFLKKDALICDLFILLGIDFTHISKFLPIRAAKQLGWDRGVELKEVVSDKGI